MLHGPCRGATAVQTTAELVPCRLRCLRARALPGARHAGMPVVQTAAVTSFGRSCAGRVPSHADRHGVVSRRPVHRRRQRTRVQCLQQQQQQQEETAIVNGTQTDVATEEKAVDSNGDVVAEGDGGQQQQQQRRLPLFDAKRDVRRRVQNFRYTVPVADGVLEVRPLMGAEVQATTDLLTEVFATLGGPGWNVYTRYMRNQIRKFLETQLELPPDAVVLIAVLHPAGWTGPPASQLQAALASQPATSASASGQNGAAAGGECKPVPQSASSAAPGPAPDPAPAGSSCADDAEVAAANGVYYPSPVPEEDQDDEPAQGRREAADGDDLLVGTFEVAFTEAARTKELTLNPPSDGAYLSNMCTAPEHRRLGYGAHMLTAAEHLTRVTAYRKIYLHNRIKDKPATALYQSLGYQSIKQDCILWALLGQDRRYLMCKAVPADVDGDVQTDVPTEQYEMPDII